MKKIFDQNFPFEVQNEVIFDFELANFCKTWSVYPTCRIYTNTFRISSSYHTGITNKSKIINTALSEYLGKIRRKNLMGAYGKIDLDIDARELRNRELKEMKELYEQL